MTEPLHQPRLHRILVIAPDAGRARELCAIVSGEGFEPATCDDLTVARQRVEKGDAAAILLESASGGAAAQLIGRSPPMVLLHRPENDVVAEPHAGQYHVDVRQGEMALCLALHRVVRDATLRNLDESLESSRLIEKRFRSVLEAIPDTILLFGIQGRIMQIYSSESHCFDMMVEDLAGRDVGEVFPADVSTTFRVVIDEVAEHGESRQLDFSLVTDDRWRWYSASFVRFDDVEGGDEIQVLCVMRDITGRQLAELNKAEMEERLRQAQKMQAVGTLAAGAAHDFNNLLTAIAGYTDFARTSVGGDETACRAIDGIDAAVKQARDVTGSLLMFSRAAATEKKSIHLGEVTREALRLLHRMLPASVIIETDIADDAPLWIVADRNQIMQVVVNLAVNSRDSMVNGGTLSIVVKHDSSSRPKSFGSAFLEVRDDGVGMPRKKLARIFEPFFSAKRRAKVAELGMSVIHGIVTDHAGEIEVDSDMDSGTRVSIRFPCCAAPAVVGEGQKLDHMPSGRGETVIVSEDNDQVLAIMTSCLESAGYRVVQARNGHETLSAFDAHCSSVRLAVMDVDLPGRNGSQCLDEFMRRRPDLPVIMSTGSVEYQLGSNHGDHVVLLRKPFHMAELRLLAQHLLTSAEQSDD